MSLGKKPEIKYRQGRYNIAASFVLRCFDNKRVNAAFPEGRFEIPVQKGQYLDTIIQDGKSYRYLVIDLGATDEQELSAKFELGQKLLPFEFEN
jgi:hypothetical protein